ncbi:oligosaccharide flippase family protein [Desulfopila inferna]|uniref:oligosaccharide flippase family protein n=1 Tax=Desulfopila inferna TaxID=468528 RepID=UPI00196265E2|nr:polysaccharide biosynthesis C-terminal domain-containing protein [Desulfopila inferna]MBM9605788.1 polysaccharide biosynthesis C-terminal domain-containing protein [Desulfopila inferna]
MIHRIRIYLTSTGLGPDIVRAMVGSVGIRIVGMLCAFLVGIQLARTLGADGYGVYGLALSILSIGAIPMQFGLPALLTREVAAAEVKNDWPIIRGVLRWSNRTVLMLSFVTSIVILTALLIFKDQIDSELQYALIAGLLLMPLVALGNLRGAALRGLRHIVKGQFPDIIIRPAMFSLMLLFVPIILTRGLNPVNAMVAHSIAAVISFTVAGALLRVVLPAACKDTLPEIRAKLWWKSAIPMALAEGLRLLQGNLSILLLGVISTTAMVGVFRVASSTAMLLIVPVSLIHTVSATFFSRLYAAKDYQRLQLMLKWVSLAMVLGVFVVTLPFLLVGEQLLASVFGAEFLLSNTPLLILSAGSMIGSAFGASVTLLNMTNHEKRVTRAFGLSLLILGVGAPLCIMLWGAVGAALANSIAFISFSVLTWWDVRHLLHLDTSLIAFIRLDARYK